MSNNQSGPYTIKISYRRNSFLALTVALALLANQATAGTTWNGNAIAATGNWQSSANWEGVLPTFDATTDLLFRNISANNLQTSVIQANRTVRSLTFNSNVTNGFQIRLTTTTESGPLNLTMGNAANAAAITVNSDAVGNITIGKGSGSVFGNLILSNNLAVAQNSTSATLTIDGPITESGGSYGVTKTGTGILTLSGTNTYTGVTTNSAGTLQIGAGGTSGSIAGNIVNDAALLFNRSDSFTYSGVISGSGTLTKTNTGTLTLSNTNSYTGNITIDAGTLSPSFNSTVSNPTVSPLGNPQTVGRLVTIASAGTLNFRTSDVMGDGGTIAQLKLVANGGTIRNFSSQFNALGPVELNGGTLSSFGGASASFPSFALRGTITVGGSAVSTISSTGANSQMGLETSGTTFDVADAVAGSDLNVTAVLANWNGNAGALIKTGAGTLTLSAANTYSGGTVWGNPGGILSLGNNAALGTAKLTIQNTGSSVGNYIQSSDSTARTIANRLDFTGNNISFNTGGSGDLTFTGPVDLSAGAERTIVVDNPSTTLSGVISQAPGVVSLTKSGPYPLILTGVNTYTAVTTISSGTLEIGGAGRLGSGSYANSIVNNGAFLYNSTAAQTLSGVISGSGALSKANSGSLTLSGANTYKGLTTVSNGSLIVNGSLLSTGSVEVASAGTLGGNGSVGNVLLRGGTISPGLSPGILSVSSLTMTSGTYRFEITNAIGTAGVGWDLITVGAGGGAVTNAGGTGSVTVKLVHASSSLPGFTGLSSNSWKIVDAGSQSGFAADKFVVDTSEFVPVSKYNGTFSVSSSGGDLFLDFTPVPNMVDLSVTVIASTNFATANDLVTFTVIVSNHSGAASSAYTVTNMFGGNVTIMEALNGGSISGSDVVWALGNLGAGSSTSLTATVRPVYTGSSNELNNTVTAVVAPAYTDPTPGNNSASSGNVVTVGIPMLSNLAMLLLAGVVAYAFWRWHRRPLEA